jgi:hypothetical protein
LSFVVSSSPSPTFEDTGSPTAAYDDAAAALEAADAAAAVTAAKAGSMPPSTMRGRPMSTVRVDR